MTGWLSQSTLMRPEIPSWLEEIVHRLSTNDSSLIQLNLVHNRMDDIQARYLAEHLADNTCVKFAAISFYNLVDDGPFALANALRHNKGIQQIQLRDLRHHRETSQILEGMSSLQQLEELSFRHCQMDIKSANTLEKLLYFNMNILELRLVDTRIQSACLPHLCSGVKNSTMLRRLYLVNNNVGGEHLGTCLAGLVRTNSSMEQLYLGENDIGDAGLSYLVSGLQENSQLTHLHLPSNGIGPKGAKMIANLLAKTNNLRAISLQINNLGDEGVEYLMRGVLDNRELQSLDLGDNGIGSSGALEIANMLKKNESLTDLSLACNNIGDVGAAQLSKVLVENVSLHRLSIPRNRIGLSGAQEFAYRLPVMRGLNELDFVCNDIGSQGMSAILAGVRRNMELVNFKVNRTPDNVFREILHWIHMNRAGRKVFRDLDLPIAAWSRVLSRQMINLDLDVLYHFLIEKPEILVEPIMTA